MNFTHALDANFNFTIVFNFDASHATYINSIPFSSLIKKSAQLCEELQYRSHLVIDFGEIKQLQLLN